MVNEDSLKAKIDARRSAVQKLDRERDRFLAEISAFEEILADIRDAHTEPKNPQERANESHDDEASESSKTGRGLSPDWKSILKKLGRDDQFDYDAVIAAASKCGLTLDKPSVRSRIFGYVKSEYVERIQDGLFRITQKGRDAAE